MYNQKEGRKTPEQTGKENKMKVNKNTIEKAAAWVANTTKENETTKERTRILAKRIYKRFIRKDGKNFKVEWTMAAYESTIARKANKIIKERA